MVVDDKSKTVEGVFSINDYPEDTRNENFYFYEYCTPDGEWIEENEPICKVQIGESEGCSIKLAQILAVKSGVIEWTIKHKLLLTEGVSIYKLHEKGIYNNENTVEKEEYKHFFPKKTSVFWKWLVNDGDYIEKGTEIYCCNENILSSDKYVHRAEKSGHIDIIQDNLFKATFKVNFKEKDLVYYIRDNDYKRIEEKYKNIPIISIDDFTKAISITWERVSANDKSAYGIISKSVDRLIELNFTLNYIQDCDRIVFHINPKQLKLKQNDKISFLFENDDIIEFKLDSNPISIINRNNERVIEYKSLITNRELQTFANQKLKKWKISITNENRDIIGGDFGGLKVYEKKENLQIVICKFVEDYLSIAKKNILDYSPVEDRISDIGFDSSEDFCYVYLMLDISNGYYKIGISNKPYYREKTLQSEKPTINLITSKRYPTRKIAESIEKSLHLVFGEKRIRGEWFVLTEKDVEHIMETLK